MEPFASGVGPENRPDGDRTEAMPARPQFVVWQMMVGVLVFAVLFALAVYTGLWVLLVPLTVLLVSMVIAAVVILVVRRGAQQDAMLWTIATAVERRLPLAPGIEAFADLCSLGYRWRVLALAQRISAGVALPEALLQIPRVLPRVATVYTRMGWDAGLLARALRDVAAARTAWRPFRHTLTLRVLYLGWILYGIQAVSGFMLYFIVPKFEAIFADYGAELPAITIVVIKAGHFLIGTWILPILLVLQFVLLLGLPLLFFDWFHWDLPILDRLVRRRHAAVVLRALAIGMEGGQPLPRMLAVLAQRYPSRWIRGRLRGVRDDVAGGSDWRRSLRTRGILRGAEAAVLEAAERVGNLPWALRELAEGIERRSGVRFQAWSQVLFPLIVMGLGGLVALFAVAYFLPLVQLIQRLTP
ncbi:MAG TPA: type II secretion system F family protein [Isosphaeraceae bacterium]